MRRRVLLYSNDPTLAARLAEALDVSEAAGLITCATFVELYAQAFESRGDVALVDAGGSDSALGAHELAAFTAPGQVTRTIVLSSSLPAEEIHSALAFVPKPVDVDALHGVIVSSLVSGPHEAEPERTESP